MDQDPLQLRGTGEEPIIYVEEYFGNFTLCKITEIPLNIRDRLLPVEVQEDPNSILQGCQTFQNFQNNYKA